nr:hypothetical protein [Thermus sediminis]
MLDLEGRVLRLFRHPSPQGRREASVPGPKDPWGEPGGGPPALEPEKGPEPGDGKEHHEEG